MVTKLQDFEDEPNEAITWDISILRKELGLPVLEFKQTQCRRSYQEAGEGITRCRKLFMAQYVGGKQRQFYCRNCRHIISSMLDN